jgi:ElaB/YqjD/DUF883 family membrane-anchored ribosome-binding protein
VTDQRDPQQIQQEIETTRAELGETVAALAQKADVKAQARQKLQQTRATVTATTDRALTRAREASPDSAGSAAARLSQRLKENPLPIAALAAFAVGFLAGRLAKRERD